MTSGRFVAPLVGLVFACASASAVLVAAPAPTPALAAAHEPIKPAIANLLIANRYEVRVDGTIWAPGGAEQVNAADLPMLLSRLKSSQRLKALLKLDLILTASDGEKYLTPSEREQIRVVLRDSWPYFNQTTRRHFKMYFSLEELEKLNRSPVDDVAEPMLTMRDPEIEVFPEPPAPIAAPTPAPAPAPLAVAPVLAPAPALSVAQAPRAAVPGLGLLPVPAPISPPKIVPNAPVAAAPTPTPTPTPAPAVVAAPTPAPAASTPAREAVVVKPADLAGFNVVGGKIPAPIQAPSIAPIVVAPPPPKLEPLGAAAHAAAPNVASGELEKLLADAPYGRDVKTLLRLIAEKAPEPARTRALALVVSNLPPIYVDAERAGLSARAAVEVQEAADGQRAVTIALNPSGVLIRKKRMFFGGQTALVPEHPSAWAKLKLAPPPANALKPGATAAKVERGPWGETRSYEDDSDRIAYSQFESAGSLLYALVLADAKRTGWAVSPYAAEVVARSAQMQLYDRMITDSKDDSFLDPEMKAFYRQWRDRPSDFRDFLIHTSAASGVGTLDTAVPGLDEAEQAARKAYAACPDSLDELNLREAAAAVEALKKAALTLARARVADQAQFDEALKALDASARKPGAGTIQDCARRFRSAVDGLATARALMAEVATAERARIDKAEGRAHAR